MSIAALTLFAALAMPSAAEPGLAALSEARLALRPAVGLAGRSISARRIQAASQDAARRIEKWLGLVDEAQTGFPLDPVAVREEVAAGLSSGRTKALVLGESHSIAAEKSFARELLALLLSRGLRPSAFIRETHTYDDASALASQGVPVLDFRNQFQPDGEIDAALKRHRGTLATYSGHAHSCERVKDYVQNVLLAGLPFGYGPGKKDMPTIERAFLSRGLKPAIVSMLAEEAMLGRIERLFLKEATATAPDLATLRAGLEEAASAWRLRLGRLPSPAHGLHFFRHPKQDNLIMGITRGERRPLALESALAVLSAPDVEAWLAGEPIASLESLYRSSGDGRGGVARSYEVVVHKKNGAALSREIPVF